MSAWQSLSAPFRHRDFRLLFAGQLASLVGSWVQTLAFQWLVYRLTGSSALLGATGFVAQVPILVLATAGGVVADRVGPRRLMLVTQPIAMALALVLAALTMTETVRVWHVVLVAACFGVVEGFDLPAAQAFVARLVPPRDLQAAIGLNSAMITGARTVGPAIAALLLTRFGEAWCFVANAVSFLAVVAALLAMRAPPAPAPPARARRPSQEVAEGFRFVATSMPTRSALAVVGMVVFAGSPSTVLVPAYAAVLAATNAGAVGLLMGAAGGGALLGSLSLAIRKQRDGLEWRIAAATTALGVSLVALALSRSLAVGVTLMVPTGFFMTLAISTSNALIQSIVPDALRGRVMAVFVMVFMGMMPLGALGAGLLAARTTTRFALYAGGLLCLATAILFVARARRIATDVADVHRARSRDAIEGKSSA